MMNYNRLGLKEKKVVVKPFNFKIVFGVIFILIIISLANASNEVPNPEGINFFRQDLQKSLDVYAKPLSIVGPSQVISGETYQYIINLTPATRRDGDCSDGSCEYRYGYWVLVDRDMNIFDGETIGELVDEDYIKTVSVTIPNNPENFVILGLLTQTSMNYVYPSWQQGEETILLKETISVSTGKSWFGDLFSVPWWSWIIIILLTSLIIYLITKKGKKRRNK